MSNLSIDDRKDRPSKIEEIFDKFDAKEEPKIRIRKVSRDLVINESKIRIETNSIRNLLDLKSRKWDKEKESSSVYSELHNSVKSILKCFEDEEYLVVSAGEGGKGKQLRGDCFGNVSIGSRTFLLHSSIYRGKFR